MIVLDELASMLAKARLSKRRITGLSAEQVSKLTMEDGYSVMKKTTKLLEAEKGWNVAGFKVGATSKAAQQRMGMNGPFWGTLFEPSKVVASHRGGNIPRFSISQDLIRGIETEFAFNIKKDITPRNNPYTAEELVMDHCSTVIPCVEVCGSRVPVDFAGSAPLLIADTGNTAVVFPSDSFARSAADVYKDLPSSKATMFIDGVQVAEGSGAEVLGSPVSALEWLVKEVCGLHGMTIPQGSFVITGATSGLKPITSTCYVHAGFSGISKADIHIAFRE